MHFGYCNTNIQFFLYVPYKVKHGVQSVHMSRWFLVVLHGFIPRANTHNQNHPNNNSDERGAEVIDDRTTTEFASRLCVQRGDG